VAVFVWIAFIVLVLAFLALDLGVFHRRAHVISIREALAWTAFWVAIAIVFNGFVFFLYEHHWLDFGTSMRQEFDGGEAALKFFTGYLVEKSLSVDNIFVIAMIFAYFGVPLVYQHRVLFWGILGALVLRGTMIAAGAALIAKFSWTVYIFGALLLLTAAKLLVTRHDNLEPGRNILVRWARKMYPVSSDFDGSHFFTVVNGKRAITPLFLALIVVESSDVIFAVDSIPAIFAITHDPFIVFTSNVFAILGLRSLYFAVAGLIARFRFLKMSLVFLLAFVGVKMILAHHHPIPTAVSLAIIVGILAVGILASVFASHRDTAPLESPLVDDLERLAAVGRRQARRIVILIVGSTVLLLGGAMLVLPGPGILVTIAGLSILAVEFVWARLWLRKIKETVERAVHTAGPEGRGSDGRTGSGNS
jgi:tellurite resistance protein TerC